MQISPIDLVIRTKNLINNFKAHSKSKPIFPYFRKQINQTNKAD